MSSDSHLRIRTAGRSLLGLAGPLALTVFLAAAGGCDDVSTDLDRLPQRPVRPAPVPLAQASQPATAPTSPPPVTEQPAQRAPTAPPSAPAEPEPAAPAAITASYQQLVLLSEPMPEDRPQGLQFVPLKHAPAQELGCVLAWLYLPAGPAGSRDRYMLLYPSLIEAEAAVHAAADLDVPPVKEETNAVQAQTGAEAFALGVGLLYREAPEERLSAQRLRRAERLLAQAIADKTLPSARRWAAGMIAGNIATERLRDLEAANRHFAAAAELCQSGSLEQMATWLAQSSLHIQNGEPRAAQTLLNKIVTGFDDLRATEIFDRAQRAKGDLDRGR